MWRIGSLLSVRQLGKNGQAGNSGIKSLKLLYCVQLLFVKQVVQREVDAVFHSPAKPRARVYQSPFTNLTLEQMFSKRTKVLTTFAFAMNRFVCGVATFCEWEENHIILQFFFLTHRYFFSVEAQ